MLVFAWLCVLRETVFAWSSELVCVWVKERECVCVCFHYWERERGSDNACEWERVRVRWMLERKGACVYVYVWVCACVWEIEWVRTVQRFKVWTGALASKLIRTLDWCEAHFEPIDNFPPSAVFGRNATSGFFFSSTLDRNRPNKRFDTNSEITQSFNHEQRLNLKVSLLFILSWDSYWGQ